MKARPVITALTMLLVGSAAFAGDEIDFARDIRPILGSNCLRCHGHDEGTRQRDLRLDEPGRAIVAGDRAASPLWQRITESDEAMRMPPHETGLALSGEEIELLGRWIDEGAPYAPHWAFTAPVAPAAPTIDDQGWSRQPFDRHVLAALARDGHAPAPEADIFTLLRRASLDLTGLPPTPEEALRVAADPRSDAYERFVDELLASPAYAERWASVWLDLARYADTKGYEKDGRRTMWPYRDWVIRAIDADMPFDQFTIEQLAGDLLPSPSQAQHVATAFSRNTMTNDEGGTDDEEFRCAAVVDRVNTTFQVWMGLTVGCAQCHDHKYDPISMREYYELFAFFDQSEDADRPNEAPTMPVPDDEIAARIAGLERDVEEMGRFVEDRRAMVTGRQPGWERSLLARAGPTPDDVRVHLDLDGSPGRATEAGGAAVWVDGVDGRAVDLRQGRYLALDGAGDFDNTDAFTVAFWMKLEGGGASSPIARMDEGAKGHRGWDVYVDNGRVGMHLVNTWPSNAIRVMSKTPVVAREAWHHVAVTVDGSGTGAGVTLYVDGRAAALDVTHDTLTATTRNALKLHVGRREAHAAYTGSIDDVRLHDRALLAAEVAALAEEPIAAIVKQAAHERSPAHAAVIRRFVERDDAELADALGRLAAAERRLSESRRRVPTLPIMRELRGDQRRVTHVHERGNFMARGEVVQPGVPHMLPPLADGAPRDRLGLARWIVSPDNPLTSRVVVNRYWERLFGIGLVETSENFGMQGALPSHPEVLDELALGLVESGWSLKELCRTIVTSATYRQSSRMHDDCFDDPRNQRLGRGSRFRLSSEGLRDQALAISGLLSAERFGPPVHPHQPDGVWQMPYSGDKWTTSAGDDAYRRAVYTFWRRTAPYPSMIAFDAPSREFCVSRRLRTNTPLQALVTLNDPVYVEAAQALARRMVREGGDTPGGRAARGLRLCVIRAPRDEEIEVLVGLYESELVKYRARPEDARALATDPLGPLPPGMNAAELAAWTVVANVLLNLDEVLTRG